MKKLLLELTALVWEVNQIEGYDAGITYYDTGGTDIYIGKSPDISKEIYFRITFSDRLFKQKDVDEARDYLNGILTSNQKSK